MICLKGHQGNCTCIPPTTDKTTCPSPSTLVYYVSWPARTAIAESKQSSLSEVGAPLCFGTSVVERTPDQCQDSGITRHPRQQTQE